MTATAGSNRMSTRCVCFCHLEQARSPSPDWSFVNNKKRIGGLTAGAELTVIRLGVQKREAERPKVEVVQVEEEVVHEDNDWGERRETTHPRCPHGAEAALDSNCNLISTVVSRY